jgi:hypothetical protein
LARIIAIEQLARRSKKLVKPVYIPLTQAQRKFLLFRLQDLTGSTERVLHHPPHGRIISQWTREQILNHCAGLVRILRSDGEHLLVIGAIQKALIVQAIECNPYFVDMHDSDPRLCSAAIAQADALRLVMQATLHCPIKPVPLGRKRVQRVA